MNSSCIKTIIALSVSAALLTGCGGGGSDSTITKVIPDTSVQQETSVAAKPVNQSVETPASNSIKAPAINSVNKQPANTDKEPSKDYMVPDLPQLIEPPLAYIDEPYPTQEIIEPPLMPQQIPNLAGDAIWPEQIEQLTPSKIKITQESSPKIYDELVQDGFTDIEIDAICNSVIGEKNYNVNENGCYMNEDNEAVAYFIARWGISNIDASIDYSDTKSIDVIKYNINSHRITFTRNAIHHTNTLEYKRLASFGAYKRLNGNFTARISDGKGFPVISTSNVVVTGETVMDESGIDKFGPYSLKGKADLIDAKFTQSFSFDASSAQANELASAMEANSRDGMYNSAEIMDIDSDSSYSFFINTGANIDPYGPYLKLIINKY